jgi:fatty acid desaturase
LWTLTEFTTGWLLAFMFQVAHVTPDVEFFKVDEKTGVISSNKSWAEAQLASSADFAHGSKFWTHFSGGLNYQVIHHLFPGVCHVHYPQLAPLVMDVCKKRGLEYVVYPTFWAALRAHFRHLKNVGGGAFKVPSLHTVG